MTGRDVHCHCLAHMKDELPPRPTLAGPDFAPWEEGKELENVVGSGPEAL